MYRVGLRHRLCGRQALCQGLPPEGDRLGGEGAADQQVVDLLPLLACDTTVTGRPQTQGQIVYRHNRLLLNVLTLNQTQKWQQLLREQYQNNNRNSHLPSF